MKAFLVRAEMTSGAGSGTWKANSLLWKLGQRGRVVRALVLKSAAHGFKSRSDRQIGVDCELQLSASTTDYKHSTFNTFFRVIIH